MKQPKKLTKKIKMQIQERNLNPNEWVFISESKDSYTLINKKTNETSIFEKCEINKRRKTEVQKNA